MGKVVCLVVVKLPGREADTSAPSSNEVREAGDYLHFSISFYLIVLN
jgi:hypothetical protein